MPHWTDGCIGSMEGLYFESSTTTPFHFLIQSELSKEPSRAQRDLPFRSFDIDSGIDHLQQFGVTYYASSSKVATNEALKHPFLREVAKSGPWTVFEIKNSELVAPLNLEPVIVNKLTHSEWLVPAVNVFQKGSSEVTRTIDGMDTWQQMDQNQVPELRTLPKVEISEIRNGTDYVHFKVDQVGIPVLVKTSYFPNWKAKGAHGPWRATPNFMVVVPTDEEVELNYGRSEIEVIAMIITFVGLLSLLLVPRRLSADDFSTAWFDSNLVWQKIKKPLEIPVVHENSNEEI